MRFFLGGVRPHRARVDYHSRIRGGTFMPLPWSALANPLESLRGLWQLHVCSLCKTAVLPVFAESPYLRNRSVIGLLW